MDSSLSLFLLDGVEEGEEEVGVGHADVTFRPLHVAGTKRHLGRVGQRRG